MQFCIHLNLTRAFWPMQRSEKTPPLSTAREKGGSSLQATIFSRDFPCNQSLSLSSPQHDLDISPCNFHPRLCAGRAGPLLCQGHRESCNLPHLNVSVACSDSPQVPAWTLLTSLGWLLCLPLSSCFCLFALQK